MLLRRLTLDDVVTGARLTAAAFGGQPREARMRRYLELEPEGWFGVEDAGTLVALGGAVRFGELAWLGLMVVEPGHQRAGLGRTLARAAVAWAHDQGCTTIRLIATPAGTPLYRQLGFVPDGESQELAGVPRPLPPGAARSSVHPWGARDTEEVARFDAPSFGADRSRLLAAYAREFSGSAWVARDAAGTVCGFLVVQDESLGPWAATDETVAAQLLDIGLAGIERSLRAGVLDEMGERLLLARGLTRTRALPRMRLGPDVRRASSPRLIAHASYAVG
ncbi:MAG: GNAT family N-acetyltransferase [Myxococcaceae bacterium]|nr:MAG: GNAT family N-acetyltransferase [Myxococcaceae bacterium]